MAWKDLTAEKKMLAAKTELMFSNPFFGALACQLVSIETQDVPTAATDGKALYYNPDFINGLKRDEAVFLEAHEIMHNALGHHVRRKGRDPEKWNVACDYAINGELVAANVGKMPDCGLINPQYTGLSAEEIYNLLPDQDSGYGSADPGGCGGVLDAAPEGDEAAMKKAAADMEVAVKQAAAIAVKNSQGDMPASMQRLIDTLLKPVVDWRALLRRFIDDNSTCTDYAWTRPNRRMLPLGMILPGQVPDGVSHVVIVVDTSESIDNTALSRFSAEINGAFGDGLIDRITVVYADARVSSWHEFERGDEVVLKPTGGGGTAFSDSFEWIATNTIDASAIIYFTDLCVSDFGDEPHCPVLWAVYGDSRLFEERAAATPFGQSISLAAA